MVDQKRAMIRWGERLFERRLVSGWGGNLSCRLGKHRFLITGQHAPLGFLRQTDFVLVNARGEPVNKKHQPSSETSLHLAVYHGTDARAVIHVHPPQVLAFSLSHDSFVPLSFEEKYSLGEVSILPQDTPTVTDTAGVVAELRLRPIVILKGHGTVAIGKDLQEAFLFTDLLEESVHCQLVRAEGSTSDSHHPLAPARPQDGEAYPLFSSAHIAALVQAANADAELGRHGAESGLTTSLTITLEGDGARWTMVFLDGRITRFAPEGEGDFIITGKEEWWRAIFQNRLDPFQATQQGKLKLARGEMWRLSHWFKPFQRAFTLWQTIPIK
jgi:L-fuculose-phosphate aldolase